jgi:alginate O-acetyltransferase complex protein AlgI
MIFNSISFILFFAIVVLINYILPVKFRWVWLLLCSCFFYLYTMPAYFFVPVILLLVTYWGGIQIEKATSEASSKLFYLLSIITNIGVLVFFKYSNFFTNSIVDATNFVRQKIFNATDIVHNGLVLNILAPLGISYITFQAIGYLIEIKRGRHLAEKNIGHLAIFLLFFPKIIAGPVERGHNFLPQIKTQKRFDYDAISQGLKLILWGLFKKIVIADRVAIYVSAVFENAAFHTGFTLILTAIFYVFQMYADFSGYTDMALGFAKILGYDLMPNFKRPLLAKSVTEFWRKWHISLSTWFADYFYSPIAVEKRDWGKWAVVYASFTTFIVLGFWHGANWTFIVFGFLQGVILAIEFLTAKTRKKLRKKIPVFITTITGILFTFCYFGFSLVFFRANNIGEALATIKGMAHFHGPLFVENPSMLLFSILGIIFMMAVEMKEEFFEDRFTVVNHKNWMVRYGYYTLLVLIILMAGVFDGGQFIYFKF